MATWHGDALVLEIIGGAFGARGVQAQGSGRRILALFCHTDENSDRVGELAFGHQSWPDAHDRHPA